MGLFDGLGRAFHKAVHAVESAGKTIVHGAEHIGHDIVHGVEKVGHAIGHEAQVVGRGIVHGAEAVGHGVYTLGRDVLRGVKKVEKVVVHEVSHVVHLVVDGVEHAVGDLIGVHMRNPTEAEWKPIQDTFVGEVPSRDKILITSVAGLGGRPFTIPGSLVMGAGAGVGQFVPVLGQIVLIVGLLEHLWDKYLLNMGKGGYKDVLRFWNTDFTNDVTGGPGRPGSTFVHEMTHVWQGYHRAFSWWYIFDSLYHQACCGSKAYDYKVGKNWADYGVEQQAHIVEDWYCNGSVIGSPWYRYMVSNIWTGSATSNSIFGLDPGSYFRGVPAQHPHLRF
jgi:hypothetical protein